MMQKIIKNTIFLLQHLAVSMSDVTIVKFGWSDNCLKEADHSLKEADHCLKEADHCPKKADHCLKTLGNVLRFW